MKSIPPQVKKWWADGWAARKLQVRPQPLLTWPEHLTNSSPGGVNEAPVLIYITG